MEESSDSFHSQYVATQESVLLYFSTVSHFFHGFKERFVVLLIPIHTKRNKLDPVLKVLLIDRECKLATEFQHSNKSWLWLKHDCVQKEHEFPMWNQLVTGGKDTNVARE